MKQLQILSNQAYPMVNNSTIFPSLDFGSQFLSDSIEELETQYKLQPTKTNQDMLIYRIDKEIVDSHASLKVVRLKHQEAQQVLISEESSAHGVFRLYRWATQNLMYYFNSSSEQLVEHYSQKIQFYESRIKFLSRSKEQIELEKFLNEHDNISYPASFDLSCLDGYSGVIRDDSGDDTNCEYPYGFQKCGKNLINIGDINADGLDDFAGRCDNYLIFVYYGDTEFGNKPNSGFKISTNYHAVYFDSIAGGFDLNGDEISDLIIGNSYGGIVYNTTPWSSGSVYVLFGKRNLEQDIINCTLPFLNGKNGFTINGTSSLKEQIGYSVASLGDVNADGFNDFAIGSSNNYYGYVIFGEKNLGQVGYIILANLNGPTGFKIYHNNSYHYDFSRAGDVNNDGIEDILLYTEASDLVNNFVIFGNRNLGSSGLIDLSRLNGMNGFKIEYGFYGFNYVGDINADGIDDFFLAANENMFTVFGNKEIGNKGFLSLSDLNGANGFIINGSLSYPYNSNTVGMPNYIGDFNDDGIDDLLIGCGDWKKNYYAECLIFGSPSIGNKGYFELNTLSGPNGIIFNINSYSCGDTCGGDVNLDGFQDILIGDPNDKSFNSKVYVIFGGRSLIPCEKNWLIHFLLSLGGLTLIAIGYGLYKYKQRKRILISEDSLLLNKETKYDHFPQADSAQEDPEQTENKPITLTSIIINPSINSEVLLNRNPRKNYCLCFSCCYKESLEWPFIRHSELEYDKTKKPKETQISIVYEGMYQNKRVAIKKIKDSNLDKNGFEVLTSEAKILGEHKSECIVELIGVAQEAKHTFIVMELMPGGSLYDLLTNFPNVLSLPQIILIALDICHGVLHLHENNIIHRDLKSKNILLDEKKHAKIGDFGSAKIKNSPLETKTTVDHLGLTMLWAAPELFLGEKSSKSSDIYAMCMIFWELIIRPYKHPFQDVNQYELKTIKLERKDNQETIPKDSKLCPPAFVAIIRSGWRKASQRPSAQLIAKELERLRRNIESHNQPISLDSAGGVKPLVGQARFH